MTDYDVALTIYDKLPADIARVSLEDAQQILAGWVCPKMMTIWMILIWIL